MVPGMARRIRITTQQEIAYLKAQYVVLLETGPAHKTRNRVQTLARIRARLAELERRKDAPQTFRLVTPAAEPAPPPE